MGDDWRQVVAGIDLAAGRGTREVALLERANGKGKPHYHPAAQRAATFEPESMPVEAR